MMGAGGMGGAGMPPVGGPAVGGPAIGAPEGVPNMQEMWELGFSF